MSYHLSHHLTHLADDMYIENTSRHHLAWQRSAYRTPLERKYRQHRGMIIPNVDNIAHSELHANVGPPRKATPDLMAGALVKLHQTDLIQPFDGLFCVVEFMVERDTALSIKIADHLLRQVAFLDDAVQEKV